MKNYRSLLACSALAVTASMLAAGCEGGFVTESARTSLASFVTDIISTAVESTIGPDD